MFKKSFLIVVLICLFLSVYTSYADNRMINLKDYKVPYTDEQFNLVPQQYPITGKCGYVCPINGEYVIQYKYNTEVCCEGLAAAKLNGHCSYIDENGKSVIKDRICYANNYINQCSDCSNFTDGQCSDRSNCIAMKCSDCSNFTDGQCSDHSNCVAMKCGDCSNFTVGQCSDAQCSDCSNCVVVQCGGDCSNGLAAKEGRQGKGHQCGGGGGACIKKLNVT